MFHSAFIRSTRREHLQASAAVELWSHSVLSDMACGADTPVSPGAAQGPVLPEVWEPHRDMELGTPQRHGAGDPTGTRSWGPCGDTELGIPPQGHGAGDLTGTWSWGPRGTRSWGPHRDMELPAFQHRPDTLSAATAGSSELWPGSLCWEHLRRSLLVFQSTNPWQLHFPV